MPFEELLEWVRRRPFEPFRIYLSDNSTLDVRHSELVLVGRRSAVVGIPPPEQGSPPYERSTTVSLLHIVRLEPMQAASGAR
jgi:hypothetical protein